MTERAIGTTFKVKKDEIIVKEAESESCVDENGTECYFIEICRRRSPDKEKAGTCLKWFREDEKNVVFIKKQPESREKKDQKSISRRAFEILRLQKGGKE